MSEATAAIVIPARDEGELIGRVLFGIANQEVGLNSPECTVVVVDNGSSDNTVDVAESFRGTLGRFKLRIVNEDEIGIGAACDTGFRYAVEELGAGVIARLDADTVPDPSWFATLTSRHADDPSLALLTGPVVPGLAEEAHLTDRIVIPVAKVMSKALKTIRYRSPAMMRFAPGHNMSTTAAAYVEVGGFSRKGLVTEDVEYNLRIAESFGRKSIKYETAMRVATSQRRIRNLGYIGAAQYYYKDEIIPANVSTQ
jgi:glycosyltransferase involved in cell wall biosynthesis